MNFDALDRRMRQYETWRDQKVLPETLMVARLDGRGFTQLTRERQQFEAPYDQRFRDLMAETVRHLMRTGIDIVYGYSQSDEISLLFHPTDQSFGRKIRKLNSILAGEASARFSLSLGDVASFDCRICELPNPELVIDYFRWRQEDASRNALNSHCYWLLRRQGMDANKATASLRGASNMQKHDLLMFSGINFNDLPAWHKRGFALIRNVVGKEGVDPRDGSVVQTTRRVIEINYELPRGIEYDDYVRSLLEVSLAECKATFVSAYRRKGRRVDDRSLPKRG